MKLGEVVYSKAGRDSGRYYAVVGTDGDGYALIADGDLRRIKSPKRKNVKHLRTTGDTLERIAEKLESGAQIFDAELYSALRLYNQK